MRVFMPACGQFIISATQYAHVVRQLKRNKGKLDLTFFAQISKDHLFMLRRL